MAQAAFESEELGLTEAEKASARDLLKTAGQPSPTKLIAACQRAAKNNEAGDGILEAAQGLTLDEYRAVEQAHKRIPPVKHAQIAPKGKGKRTW